MMKKFVGYIASWSLYWLGDLISRIMNYFDSGWLYPVYNRVMSASIDIQKWADNTTPWGMIFDEWSSEEQ
jgi:hypothetical protein